MTLLLDTDGNYIFGNPGIFNLLLGALITLILTVAFVLYKLKKNETLNKAQYLKLFLLASCGAVIPSILRFLDFGPHSYSMSLKLASILVEGIVGLLFGLCFVLLMVITSGKHRVYSLVFVLGLLCLSLPFHVFMSKAHYLRCCPRPPAKYGDGLPCQKCYLHSRIPF